MPANSQGGHPKYLTASVLRKSAAVEVTSCALAKCLKVNILGYRVYVERAASAVLG